MTSFQFAMILADVEFVTLLGSIYISSNQIQNVPRTSTRFTSPPSFPSPLAMTADQEEEDPLDRKSVV